MSSRQRVQRKMRRSERDVLEERLAGVLLGVLLEKLDRAVGDLRRRVVAAAAFDRRQRLVVERMLLRREEAVLVVERIRSIEPALRAAAVEMPFAGVVGAIAERLQILGQQAGPARPRSLARHIGQRVEADLLGVVAGEQRGPRRPAAGRVVELRVPQAAFGERIEIRRGDLAAVAAEVGEPRSSARITRNWRRSGDAAERGAPRNDN